jgi:hypothetical protein
MGGTIRRGNARSDFRFTAATRPVFYRALLARLVDHLIDLQARAIVGRRDERAVRLLEILARDRGQPFIAVRDCMDAPLRPSLAEVRAGSRPTNVYWG